MSRLLSPRTLISLALVLGIGSALIMGRDLDPADLQRQITALGNWAPLVFVVIFAAATVLFLPGALFGLIGGVIFGPVWGIVWNLTGATLGCALAFLAARYLIADWVRQKTSGLNNTAAAEVIKGIESEGWRFVVFVRLVPLFPFNLLNYLLGLTKLPLRDYLLTSAICMLPGTAAITYLGYAGRDAVMGGETAIRNGLIGLGLLVAVAYLPRLVKMVHRRGSWIEPQALAKQMEQGHALSLIDVRSAQEFNGPLGHIPGSQNIPLEQIPGHLSDLQGTAPDTLILICNTDKRSAKAAAILSKQGLRIPYILRGGMSHWHDRVERDSDVSADAKST